MVGCSDAPLGLSPLQLDDKRYSPYQDMPSLVRQCFCLIMQEMVHFSNCSAYKFRTVDMYRLKTQLLFYKNRFYAAYILSPSLILSALLI